MRLGILRDQCLIGGADARITVAVMRELFSGERAVAPVSLESLSGAG
jgi:hypothetical protein